jgi:hypothetical protein
MARRTHASPRTLKPNQIMGRVLVEGKPINRQLRRRLEREARREKIKEKATPEIR